MKNKNLLALFLLIAANYSYAQILGGGTTFATAVTFNQAWLTNCPSGAQTLSNEAAFEPTVALDACAPAPLAACVSGTLGSDVWFKFIAQSSTATIVVAPTSAFNIVLQAFSGSACPGLTQIGCANLLGNNGSETLNLTGLTVNQVYYFRIFGVGNNAGARTGPYTFCGSTQLGSTFLPVTLSNFTAVKLDKKVILNWTTESETNNAYFEIERSGNGNQYETIGKVTGAGTTSQTVHYNFTDHSPAAVTNYYRLKQTDIDGNYKYSSVVTVKSGSKSNNTLTVSPNPVTDKININISSDAVTTGELRIITNSGQVIYRENKRLVKGENIFTITSPAGLSKGLYTVQVITGNEVLSTRLVSIK